MLKINNNYLIVSCLLIILILFFFSLFDIKIIQLFFLIYAFSRALEIFIVFLIDGLDKMKYKPLIKHGLSYSDRFIMSLKSYLELILDYAILYFLFSSQIKNYFINSPQLFNRPISGIIEGIYFSGNTITLLGFGYISPIHPLSQFLTVFQVITGVLLLIVNFTIYVTLNFTAAEHLNNQQPKREKTGNKILIIGQIVLFLILISYLLLN